MNATAIKKPSVEEVAIAFSNVLKKWLTKEEMAKIVALNAKEKDPIICHSQDFCDANMAMDAAFKKADPTFYRAAWADNRKTNGEGKVWGQMNNLWNLAWNFAKNNNFYFGA